MSLIKNISAFIFLFILCSHLFARKYMENRFMEDEREYSLKIDSLRVLIKASSNDDKSLICHLYSQLAGAMLNDGDPKMCSVYLERANEHLPFIDDGNVRGYYYNVLGNYHSINNEEAESHKYYYKSIAYYEKSKDDKKPEIIKIFNNIAFSYIQKRDVNNLKILISRIAPTVKGCKDNSSLAVYYRVLSYYYRCLYATRHNDIYIDSCIVYGNKVIELYEKRKPSDIFSEQDIAYTYIDLANNYLHKDNYDTDLINSFSEKAIQLAHSKDTMMLLNYLSVQGNIMISKGKNEKAKDIYKKQIEILDKKKAESDLTMYADLHGNIAGISAEQRNFEEAYEYAERRYELSQEILDNDRFHILTKLQTLYETEKKDTEIREQRRLIATLLITSISVVILLSFFVLWMKRGKNIAKKQLKIATLEKSEAKLLTEQSGQKEGLQREQIELISCVKTIIESNLKNFAKDKERYLKKLTLIEDGAVFILRNKEMSPTEIQYCICTSLGMKKKHIMRCYNIEDQTVRLNRYNIKSKLDLEKDDNLDIYLIYLIMLNQR